MTLLRDALRRLEAGIGERVFSLLQQILTNQEAIMTTLQDISDAETAEGVAIQTVLTNLATLQTALATAQANGADPVAMQAIIDKIHANTALLTGALPPAVTTPVVNPTIPAPPDTTPVATGPVVDPVLPIPPTPTIPGA